jgi:autophagy-related protein 13
MASTKKDKLGQVIQNFFLKTSTVIIQSRSSNNIEAETTKKLNRWFNIDTYDLMRDDLKPWKASQNNTTPIVIETYLDLRELTIKQSLILKDDDKNIWNINTKKSEIVMERWLIEIDTNVVDEMNSDLPSLYKRLVITFRYLYTMTKLLPLYKLHKKLSKIKLTQSPLNIGVRVFDGNRPILSKGRIGLSKPIITSSNDVHLSQKAISPVATSAGTLKISVSYRKNVEFQLIDNEETLSTHFINIDKAKTASNTAVNSSSLKKTFRSGTASPPSSSPLTRNESSASIAQALKIQRSNTLVSAQNASFPKSITSSIGSTHGGPFSMHATHDLSSSGSTPKYSSSFLKVARRSSLRRSSSVEKGTPPSLEYRGIISRNAPSASQNDGDLKDFVKLIDTKHGLTLSYSPNVQDSLGKFQLMRGKNDELGESLTASMYSKSVSVSPPLSLNHPSLPQSINSSRFQQNSPSLPQNMGQPGASPNTQPQNFIQSLRRLSQSPRSQVPDSITRRLSEANSSSESLYSANRIRRGSSVPLSRNSSDSPEPGLLERSYRSFSIGPSNPTIAETPTHAKMHKIPDVNDNNTNNNNNNDQYEEDDLLFTMSDMNLSKS